MNDAVVPCPKCMAPDILYATRSMNALIDSKHIAHVLHPSAAGNPNRRTCLLTRAELERMEPTRIKLR